MRFFTLPAAALLASAAAMADNQYCGAPLSCSSEPFVGPTGTAGPYGVSALYEATGPEISGTQTSSRIEVFIHAPELTGTGTMDIHLAWQVYASAYSTTNQVEKSAMVTIADAMGSVIGDTGLLGLAMANASTPCQASLGMGRGGEIYGPMTDVPVYTVPITFNSWVEINMVSHSTGNALPATCSEGNNASVMALSTLSVIGFSNFRQNNNPVLVQSLTSRDGSIHYSNFDNHDPPTQWSSPFDVDSDGVPNSIDNCPDTANGDQADEDGDGIGDACAPLPADLDGNGVVDGGDLGQLLGLWGTCPGCAADLDLDGDVDGADLGLLLAAWST